MGLMTSQLRTFRSKSFLSAFAVPKLILLFTGDGWSAQPYSNNFGLIPTVMFIKVQSLANLGLYSRVRQPDEPEEDPGFDLGTS